MRNTESFVIAVLLSLFTACAEPELGPIEVDDSGSITESVGDSEAPYQSGMTVLGDAIPNAYTPEVMREALALLKAECGTNKSLDITMGEDDITATHIYLRFAPRDSVDAELLDNDTTIMYTVIPMDREIAVIGDYYHDPSLPDTVPTFQYCVAKVGQPLPDVPHEVLSELFLMEETNVFESPEEYEDEIDANKSVEFSIWDDLEAKALELTGVEINESVNKSKWRPEGYVRYKDNTLGEVVPMEGVPVRIKRGFVTSQCCTNSNGYFSFSKRRHHVQCYVKWRRDNFHIREIGHSLQQAESTLASHTKSIVSFTFTPYSDGWYYASVFRAAHQYYYNYGSYGLGKPGNKNLKIKLSGNQSTVLGTYHHDAVLTYHDIDIYYKKMTNAIDLFRVTAHEIGHSAHHYWNRSTYHDITKKMRESWARGVEWRMMNVFYGIDRSLTANYDYTFVVRDLIDDNGGEKVGPSGNRYTENVTGISMPDIEIALRKSGSWSAWRDNIVKIYPNKKDGIYEVFGIWADK